MTQVTKVIVQNARGPQGASSGPLGAGAVNAGTISDDGNEQIAILAKLDGVGSADLASTAPDAGAALVGTKSTHSGAVNRTVRDKLGDLPHIYDLIAPADRTTSFNAATALQAALDSGERFVLPNAEIRFSGGLTLTTNNGGFIGQGKGSRLVTTSSTGDIFTIGNGTDEISGVRFEGFSLFSTVTRTSGHAFNCRKITDGEFLYLRVGSRDDYTASGNRHYRGLYFDRYSDVDIYGGEVVAQQELVRLRGNADQTIGAECTMGGGLLLYKGTTQIHVGGGCGGVKLESMDASAGQIAMLIDETLQATYNREVIISPACSFDSFSTAGIVIDQPTSSVARFIFRGNWVAGGGSGAHAIWIKNAEQARIFVSSMLYGNGGDGLRIDDDQVYVVFTGEADLNTGYGINPTVATSRLHLGQGAYFLANTAGAFNKTNMRPVLEMQGQMPRLPAFTVGAGANQLPAASGALVDCLCVVTDSSVTTLGSVVSGGGSGRVFVKCDGANWRVVSI